MTYIVGIQKPAENFSALICDLMVTFEDHNGNVIDRNNASLKTGLLFKGCIYGVAGNAGLAKKFITGFRDIVDKSKTMDANWQLFQDYSKYNFSDLSGNHFKVLLSCRVSGQPQLFLYDSSQKAVSKIEDEIFTIGSGKEILDDIIEVRRGMAEKVIVEAMSRDSIPLLYYPYFYCLWLSELTMGFETSQLEKIGVGGLFHFCFQTDIKEGRQQSSVFVLSVPDTKNKKIYNHVYRITFVDKFLVVDNPLVKPSRFIIMPFEMTDSDFLSMGQLKGLGEKINKEADLQQFYYFCGFGFPSPKFRGSFTCHLSSDKNKLVVDKGGNIHPDFRKKIERNIVSVQGASESLLSIIKETMKHKRYKSKKD
jgi:hypothetical protein